MRAEPPDPLTAQVWQMLADARVSTLTPAEVIEELILSPRRDAAYLARRRGKQKAAVAVAHSVLTIIYHLLRDKRPYADLGADYFDKLDATCIQRHHVHRLEQLGYTVTLTPIQVA